MARGLRPSPGRFVYDPYGAVTVLNADWSADGLSDVQWTHFHQGGRLDAISGLYHFRHRDYDPNLGRWVQQDPNPAGVYADGMNLYQYVGSSPITLVDPVGLEAARISLGGQITAADGPIYAGPTTRPGRYAPGEPFVPDDGQPSPSPAGFRPGKGYPITLCPSGNTWGYFQDPVEPVPAGWSIKRYPDGFYATPAADPDPDYVPGTPQPAPWEMNARNTAAGVAGVGVAYLTKNRAAGVMAAGCVKTLLDQLP